MKKTLLLIIAVLALASCASCVKRQGQPASFPADERKALRLRTGHVDLEKYGISADDFEQMSAELK